MKYKMVLRKLKDYPLTNLHKIIAEIFDGVYLFRDDVDAITIYSERYDSDLEKYFELKSVSELEKDYAGEYNFTVRFHAIKRNENGEIPLILKSDIISSFKNKVANKGFHILNIDCIVEPPRKIIKHGNVIPLHSCLISGKMMIKDGSIFKDVISGGIGRGKAYGFGLFMVEKNV